MSETPTSSAPGNRPLPPDLSPRGRTGGRHGAARTGGAATIAPGTSGGRRLGRALSWVAALFSLLILLGSGGGYLYTKSQFDSIKSVGPLCLRGCAGQPGEVGETENFLLVGTDTRAGANSTGNLSGDGGTAVSGGNGNSDTTLLVHISVDQKKVIVVSFPRDLLVNVPTYTNKDGTPGLDSGQPAKFNAAFSVGGPTVLVKQVEQLTGLPVDHYLSIDFSGFQGMVNAVGGVTVCLKQAAYDPGGDGSGGSGFKASAGTHKLNGIQALMYVRQRHGLPNGDLDRIERQQLFLSALIRQAKSPSVLFNPLKLNNFLSAIVNNVSKDSGTSEQDLLGLVTRLKGLSPAAVEFNTVPVAREVNSGTSLGDYLTIDSAKAHTLFQAISNDEDPANPPKPKPSPKVSAAPTPSTAPLTVAPADITLAVANGSGITGKGAATSAELQGLGYHVSAVSTQTRSDPTSTVISYGSDKADSAKTLAAAIPGSVLTPDTTDGPEALTLVVGTDYTAAQAVTIGSVASTAPTAAATTAAALPTPTVSVSPTAKPITAAAADSCGP